MTVFGWSFRIWTIRHNIFSSTNFRLRINLSKWKRVKFYKWTLSILCSQTNEINLKWNITGETKRAKKSLKWNLQLCTYIDLMMKIIYFLSFFFFMWQLVLLSVVISLIVSVGFILSAQTMHESLLTSVLRWAMELFDTTPLGRILNRFSKDVDTVDNVLPQCIRGWLLTFFSVNLHLIQPVLISFFSFFILFCFILVSIPL